MKKIKIEWLYDYAHCETCGGAGAEGGKAYVDGVLAVDMSPVAHCYDGTSYTQDQVVEALFKHLGYSVEIEESH